MKIKDVRTSLSIHIRAFVRAIASDEPIYIVAHPMITDVLKTFNANTFKENANAKEAVAFHSPLIYKLQQFCDEKKVILPQSFYDLLNQIGELAESFVTPAKLAITFFFFFFFRIFFF